MGRRVLLIEGRRDAYSIDQILDSVKTMTVGELIDALDGYDRDLPVMLDNDNGYTYGAFSWNSFEEGESDDDEGDE